MNTVSQIEKYDPGITTPGEILPPSRLGEVTGLISPQFGILYPWEQRNITPVDKPEDDVVE